MQALRVLSAAVVASLLLVGPPAPAEPKTVRGFVLDIPSSTVFQLDEHTVVHSGEGPRDSPQAQILPNLGQVPFRPVPPQKQSSRTQRRVSRGQET